MRMRSLTTTDIERAEKHEGRRPPSKRSVRLLAFSVLSVLSVLSVPLSAQFFAFDQNKIQYRKLDWRVLKGPHVDLYYYSAEADLAPAALASAEASYD